MEEIWWWGFALSVRATYYISETFCAKSCCLAPFSPFVLILILSHSFSTPSFISLQACLFLPLIFLSLSVSLPVCLSVCLSVDASWFSAAAVCHTCQTSGLKGDPVTTSRSSSLFSSLSLPHHEIIRDSTALHGKKMTHHFVIMYLSPKTLVIVM